MESDIFSVPCTQISPSEAMATVLIFYDIKSLAWYGYNIMLTSSNLNAKYLHVVVPFWYALATYQAYLVLPWALFCLNKISTKYKTWLSQTHLIFIPNRTFLVRFGGISGEFGRAMVRILVKRSRAKIPMARPNEPDMPPKRTKKV